MRFGKTRDGLEIIVPYEATVERLKRVIGESEELAPLHFTTLACALVAYAVRVCLSESAGNLQENEINTLGILDRILCLECGVPADELGFPPPPDVAA